MSRPKEQRITDLDTHPNAVIGLRVVAEFLRIDLRTLDAMIDEGKLSTVPMHKERKIAKWELQRYLATPQSQAS